MPTTSELVVDTGSGSGSLDVVANPPDGGAPFRTVGDEPARGSDLEGLQAARADRLVPLRLRVVDERHLVVRDRAIRAVLVQIRGGPRDCRGDSDLLFGVGLAHGVLPEGVE